MPNEFSTDSIERARAEVRRVAALRRAFAVRAAAQAHASAVASARVAAAAAEAAAEASRALQALEADLREATRMEVGKDYAFRYSDGFGGVFVALAARITTDMEAVKGAAVLAQSADLAQSASNATRRTSPRAPMRCPEMNSLPARPATLARSARPSRLRWRRALI